MLSIIYPGYRHNNWIRLYASIANSLNSKEFEVIAVGPKMPDDVAGVMSNFSNFKFIEDYGSPVRCAQIALELAKGELLTWTSDDGVYFGDGLGKSYDLLKTKRINDGICIRYHEGGNNVSDDYWVARTHSDLRLVGVEPSFKIAPLGMYYTEYLKDIGGWDCSFEHLNMCNHDLAFRIQNANGNIYLSPSFSFTCSHSGGDPDHQPIHDSHFSNDAPLLAELYCVDRKDRLKLPLSGWKKCPPKWVRRFGE